VASCSAKSSRRAALWSAARTASLCLLSPKMIPYD
jgi:hypothetical protein